ncbi:MULTISPECIES: cytochrome P450 [Cyanophyceae]|uniref:cytochrome P450 n=1 Tax=Cyanophyceae TaxID=3028117 RepID=UPI001686449F|nr:MULTISPECIES: cytochrome P450 [Cyanophyceae]MBD1915700.1 cytochrome P450 [Phormidium sp. FACHB-77]MBD2029051.1 cytochrome P450 [Phormidium sp. FACHB-322]MBD2052192.1 cytochrome P450 [Leptolyngbya sp. FACHB-60]
MANIPVEPGIDSTLGLLRDGYRFIGKRCDRMGTNVFQTRLRLEKTICMRGAAAAEVFYDNAKFSRKNAAPPRLKKTLLGEGGVQALDGACHRQRKQIFMGLMTPERLQQLSDLALHHCRQYAQLWQQQDQVVLFEQINEILCRAVCDWSGVPLPETDVARRTLELAAIIDGGGGLGLRYLRGVQARQRLEAWISEVIEKVRSQQLQVPEQTAASAFALHRDANGNLLDTAVAAVDLINVLRPTVAIGRYVVFAALALHQHPDCYSKLKGHDPDYTTPFIQEVRRFYPFFPFAPARTCEGFDWQEYHFPKNTLVLLDLYGTNHDANHWQEPDRFWPERFSEWQENAFDFIPQGGGNYNENHRCAGEWLTIKLMEQVLNFLVNELEYDVPPQNLEVKLSRMPTLPESGFVITNVKLNSAS